MLTILLFSALMSIDARAQSEVKIGVLVDVLSKDFQPVFEQLYDEISAVVGNDAKIRMDQEMVFTNGFDSDLASKQYQSLLASDADIILAFGPVNSALITGQSRHSKPTILFGAVNIDTVEIDLAKKTSQTPNFTYMIAPLSYKKDLRDFHSLYPFKNLAVVGYGPWINEDTKAVLDQQISQYGSKYELIQYTSVDQFTAAVRDNDAVYLAEGFGIPRQQLQAMAQELVRQEKPSFSANQELDVVEGWLATNQSDSNIERIFRRIALSVEAVVNGQNLSNRPIYVELNDTVTINFNTADKIGLPIRFSQIASTNLVGNFSDFRYDKRLSVIDAVELALASNLTLRASKLDIELATQDLRETRSNYLPDMSFNVSQRWIDPDVAALSGGQNPERSTTGNLGVSQLLYSEDVSAAIGIRDRLVSAQEANFNTQELDTILQTSRACFNVLRLNNALQSQAENLEITKRNLKIAQQNFDTGRSGKADIFRFQSELANNLQGLIDAINSFRQAQHALNAILDLPINTRLEVRDVAGLEDQLEPENFDFKRLKSTLDNPSEQQVFEQFLIQQALQISPELKSLNHNLAAVERDLKQYGWRRYIPTISANGQLNEVYDRAGVGQPDPNFAVDDDYSIALNFSVPLFNKNLDNISKDRAKKQREQLLLQIRNQSLAVETRVRDAVLDVSGTIANIELSSVSEQAAKQSLELVETSYANGAVTITELIDAQNNYLQSQLASANAYYNFLDQAVAMERAIGKFFFLSKDAASNRAFVEQYEAFLRQPNQVQ